MTFKKDTSVESLPGSYSYPPFPHLIIIYLSLFCVDLFEQNLSKGSSRLLFDCKQSM